MSDTPTWPQEHRIEAAGAELVAVGLPALRDAPVALCLHGYPDSPDTFWALAQTLRSAGYRVVAPWLRGYPPSGLGPDGDATGLRLGRDVLAWADALGADRVTLVGHDWGALAAYAAAALEPARIERLVTLAIPHNGAIRPTPALFRKAWHFFTLPLPGAAGRIRRGDFASIRATVRRWSPTWQGPAAEAETERMVAQMARPGGIEGALALYRSFGPWSAAARATAALLARPLAVPTLSLFGAEDGAMDDSALARTAGFFEGVYRQEVLPGVGHFLHREAPDEVARLILAFLQEG